MVDRHLSNLESVFGEIQAYLTNQRPAFVPTKIYTAVQEMGEQIPSLRKQIGLLENEWRSLRALGQIGQVVNSSIELDVVLQIVMDTIIRLTGAERGFFMLRDSAGDLEVRIARNWEQESLDKSEFAVSNTIINRVVNENKAVLTTNASEDPRFEDQHSVMAHNLRSILCVPMVMKQEIVGVIYADNRVKSGLFNRQHLELLTGFANQAATAIENARLFSSVRRTLAEVTDLKNLMDNVFDSIPSGVVTTDSQERILLCNRAVVEMLGLVENEILGKVLHEAFPVLAGKLKPHIVRAIGENQSNAGIELSSQVSGRGMVDLRLSFSPLRDGQQSAQGVAIVLEDLTETKKLEAQRNLFERMVSPAVIKELNPNSLKLGGQRREVTVLFADIRGFTSFSETVEPEQLVTVLNHYLAAAANAVLDQDGTVDKFLGDAVMAWFNAPVPQPDHTLRAVRAAIAMRDAVAHLNAENHAEEKLSFGIGIHVGDAVLGLIGTEKRLDYTAIGDSVNTAKRIQENAAGGQILMSQAAYECVKELVVTRPCGPILARGKREPIQVVELIGFYPGEDFALRI
jgi:PAS domain S-box-containing protein